MMQAETYLASWRCAEPCVTPFCASLAWPWLTLRAPVACPSVPAVRPCSRCGCAWDDHDHSDCGAGCMSGYCDCAGWRSDGQERPECTMLLTSASCSDVCTCGGNHTDGASYYVSCVPSGHSAPVALLLGPYASHSFALSMVETGRRIAQRRDSRAHWYAFGTVAMQSAERVGILMADLAEEQHEADVEWDRERAAIENPKRRARKAVSQ